MAPGPESHSGPELHGKNSSMELVELRMCGEIRYVKELVEAADRGGSSLW